MFIENTFFYNILGFDQLQSCPLGDIESFIQKIPISHKSERPITFTGIHKTRLECDVINGSFANGMREAILYKFTLDKPTGYK